MFKSIRNTTTESSVVSADRGCHRVLSRCVIIEATSTFFLRRFCLPLPLLRPGPHLTGACLGLVQISVIYLQNIFIIDARTMQCNVADGSFWWLYQLYKSLPTINNVHLVLYSIMRIVQHPMGRGGVLTLMWLWYKMIMIIVSSGWIYTNLSPSHPYCLQFPAAPQLWSPNFGDQQWIRFKLNLRWWWVKIWELQVWNWETLNLELYEEENVGNKLTVATDGGL